MCEEFRKVHRCLSSAIDIVMSPNLHGDFRWTAMKRSIQCRKNCVIPNQLGDVLEGQGLSQGPVPPKIMGAADAPDAWRVA
jgi:hypothetical protein